MKSLKPLFLVIILSLFFSTNCCHSQNQETTSDGVKLADTAMESVCLVEIIENDKAADFRYFCFRYLDKISEFKLPEIKQNQSYEAVIVEFRKLPHIEFLLRRNNGYSNFGELVAPLNVKYILLAKEVDYQRYNFLHEQEDLEVVLENEDLVAFRNKHETAKIYEVNHAYAITGWNDLIELSKTQDITNAVYLIIDETESNHVPDNAEKGILNYSKKSPVEYVVGDSPTRKYVVFTASYSHDWDYGDQSPHNNMGLTNVFETEQMKDGRIEYGQFKVYAVGYVISILFFLFLVGWYLFRR